MDLIDALTQLKNLAYAAIDATGWIPVSQSWSYASADSPVYQIYVSGDVTANASYKLGNKIKCTNNSTTVYGFIVKVGSYDSGNNRTPVDVYCGTDYSIANSAITSPYISKIKSPDGFPLSPAKWTVSLVDTTNAFKNSPTAGTYYNLGVDGGTSNLSVSIPIGAWLPEMTVSFQCAVTTTAIRNLTMKIALSTSNSSASDSELEVNWGATALNGANTWRFVTRIGGLGKVIALTAKTTYYLLGSGSLSTDAITSIGFRGDLGATLVKLVCAYL